MTQYNVTGMSCAACQARVEKAVGKLPGVTDCAVSLLTNSMRVDGEVSPETVINAVKSAGYGASLAGHAANKGSSNDSGPTGAKGVSSGTSGTGQAADQLGAYRKAEINHLKKRLIASVVFLLILMYITMGHGMLGWWLPGFFIHNHIGLSIVQMLLAGMVMFINRDFFISGFRAVRHLSPNMDTLVALGSSVSFGWSLFVVFEMSYMITQGADNMSLMEMYHNRLYFESAAMIPALITVGKLLEAISKGRTTNALESLMRLAPKTAVLLRDGEEVRVPIEEVQIGDVFVVKPGYVVPVDGFVTEGNGAINESALTGESESVPKKADDTVSAGTINMSGTLICKTTRIGEDTTLSQIVKLVSDVAATKAPIARIADKVAGVFVPVVIGISVIVFAGWLIAGKSVAFAIARAISILVISCPCALGLATPVAIMVGNGVGAKNGILFKTSEALEMTGRVRIVVMDKTGTITYGDPTKTSIIREDSRAAISDLKKLGLRLIMLSGDKEETARAIADEVGVDEVIAGVLPDGKEAHVRAVMGDVPVAMVGDGINDAPALTLADVGIAIGDGTDVAVDSADIVLMNSSLRDVVRAIRLSRLTLRNIHENLFWAFFYNIICIPLAAGLFGIEMNPMIGAAAMSLSSVTVCLNALRLNLANKRI